MKSTPNLLLLAVGLSLVVTPIPVRAFRLAVLTDVHLDLNYDPTVAPEAKCQKGQLKKSSTVAYYGRKNCDTPYALVESAVEKIRSLNPDLVLMPGDIASHFVQIPLAQEFSVRAYDQLKHVLANFTSLVREKLPNIPVVFTLGNDDYIYNYQVPAEKIKNDFYGFLHQLWIADTAAV